MRYLRRAIGILVGLAPFAVALVFSLIDWRPVLGKATVIGYILLTLGGFISVSNLYLSYLRYPLFLLFGGKKEDYRWVSGFPMLGIIALIGFLLVPQSTWGSVTIFLFLIVDTGSMSWFVVCTWKDDSLWNENRTSESGTA